MAEIRKAYKKHILNKMWDFYVSFQKWDFQKIMKNVSSKYTQQKKK